MKHIPVFNEDTALVEEVLDHLKESGVVGLGDVLQPVGDSQGAGNRSAGVQLKENKVLKVIFSNSNC